MRDKIDYVKAGLVFELEAANQRIAELKAAATAVVDYNYLLGDKKPGKTDCYGINARLLWNLRELVKQTKEQEHE